MSATANQVWGETASSLLSRKLSSKVSHEGMKGYIANHIEAMLSDGVSDAEIVATLSAANQRLAEQPAIITPVIIQKQIELQRAEFEKAGIDLRPKNWLADADEFMQQELEPREPLLDDAETGAAILYEKSLNQIFAFRGLGKSVVGNALIKVLTQGGEFLRFKSKGGYRTLLVDAELPAVQLQERLKQFSGTPKGLLKILSPELMPNPKAFPVLSVPSQQAAFLEQIEGFDPQVIIFDTLTRCFKFDTNDPDGWQVVNDFLLDLRFRGYCVVLIHHAGKNGTQRGLTTGDDNLDVTVQLEPRYGWQPGDGLQFKWKYEKVRHGGNLPGFEAEYDSESGVWRMAEDGRTAEVVELANKGKTQRSIALSLEMSQPTVNRILKKARQQGLIDLNEKHDQKA